MSLDESKLQSYLQKARVLGLDIEPIFTADDHFRYKYYIVHKSETNSLVLIPDDVEYAGKLDSILKKMET